MAYHTWALKFSFLFETSPPVYSNNSLLLTKTKHVYMNLDKSNCELKHEHQHVTLFPHGWTASSQTLWRVP
jgi:hypothetical protein